MTYFFKVHTKHTDKTTKHTSMTIIFINNRLVRTQQYFLNIHINYILLYQINIVIFELVKDFFIQYQNKI